MRRNIVSGFTLVELLIVVAIIGVLSTIGVPTYRTMVQKAKKSEAKVALGGLYTAETAFQAEYGMYGSILSKVGFDLEGAAANRVYTVGFPTTTCASGTAYPTSGAAPGSNLALVYPGYFSGTGNSDTIYPGARTPTSCGSANAFASQNSFIAGAGGIIGNSSGLSDVWSMDQNRTLSNTVDGVFK